jgi:hypothetical protein
MQLGTDKAVKCFSRRLLIAFAADSNTLQLNHHTRATFARPFTLQVNPTSLVPPPPYWSAIERKAAATEMIARGMTATARAMARGICAGNAAGAGARRLLSSRSAFALGLADDRGGSPSNPFAVAPGCLLPGGQQSWIHAFGKVANRSVTMGCMCVSGRTAGVRVPGASPAPVRRAAQRLSACRTYTSLYVAVSKARCWTLTREVRPDRSTRRT